MKTLREVVIALAILEAGWIAFDGARAIVVGEYLEPLWRRAGTVDSRGPGCRHRPALDPHERHPGRIRPGVAGRRAGVRSGRRMGVVGNGPGCGVGILVFDPWRSDQSTPATPSHGRAAGSVIHRGPSGLRDRDGMEIGRIADGGLDRETRPAPDAFQDLSGAARFKIEADDPACRIGRKLSTRSSALMENRTRFRGRPPPSGANGQVAPGARRQSSGRATRGRSPAPRPCHRSPASRWPTPGAGRGFPCPRRSSG